MDRRRGSRLRRRFRRSCAGASRACASRYCTARYCTARYCTARQCTVARHEVRRHHALALLHALAVLTLARAFEVVLAGRAGQCSRATLALNTAQTTRAVAFGARIAGRGKRLFAALACAARVADATLHARFARGSCGNSVAASALDAEAYALGVRRFPSVLRGQPGQDVDARSAHRVFRARGATTPGLRGPEPVTAQALATLERRTADGVGLQRALQDLEALRRDGRSAEVHPVAAAIALLVRGFAARESGFVERQSFRPQRRAQCPLALAEGGGARRFAAALGALRAGLPVDSRAIAHRDRVGGQVAPRVNRLDLVRPARGLRARGRRGGRWASDGRATRRGDRGRIRGSVRAARRQGERPQEPTKPSLHRRQATTG
jgi:hypothetical protein